MDNHSSGKENNKIKKTDMASAEIEAAKTAFRESLITGGDLFPTCISYSLGYILGKDLKSKLIELDTGFLATGALEALAGGEPVMMTRDEMDDSMLELGSELQSMEDGTFEANPNRNTDRISFTVGYNLAVSLFKFELDLTNELLISGIHDGYTQSAEPLLEPVGINNTMNEFSARMERKFAAQNTSPAGNSAEEGKSFLAENAKKEGISTLNSGLQYKIIKSGNGKIPELKSRVTTHYRGTLIDGTEFDSSYKRGEPATFPVNGVIAGWTEALQLMKEGDVWQLFIPSELAYGPRGAGNVIPPDSALIFEIELIKVN